MNIFQHSGAMGDIIYSIPSILEKGGGVLYITKQNQYEFLEPLLRLQDKIKIACGNGKPADAESRKTYFKMSGYRNIDKEANKANKPKHLAICHAELLGVNCDLSKPWINVEPEKTSGVVINRSKKYHDKEDIDWKLLERRDCLFIGHDRDYELFLRVGFPTYFMKCGSALDIARIIAGSKLFVGNQSLCFAIAEAMKHPRVLEVCERKNNCQPNGRDGHTYLNNKLIRRYLGD